MTLRTGQGLHHSALYPWTGALRLLDANLARLQLNIYPIVYQAACSIGPGQSEVMGFPPVLLDKDATGCIRVSENFPSRQLGE